MEKLNSMMTMSDHSLELSKPLLPSLTKTDLAVVEASQGKKLEKVSKAGINSLVNDLLNMAFLRLGHKNNYANDQERLVVADMMGKDLKNKFYGFTHAEVKIAWEMGLNGDFKKSDSEIIICSPAFLVKCLSAYKASVKPDTMKKHALYVKIVDEKPVPTLAEQLAFFKKIFLEDFQIIKSNMAEGYSLTDHGHAYYNRLVSLGLINLTVERKKEIFLEVKRAFIHLPESDIPGLCKDRVLKDYILHVIEMDLDMEEILNDAINQLI